MKDKFESLIEAIKEELKEIKKIQTKHIKKISKIKEFIEIQEMTNQVFEKRLLRVENKLREESMHKYKK